MWNRNLPVEYGFFSPWIALLSCSPSLCVPFFVPFFVLAWGLILSGDVIEPITGASATCTAIAVVDRLARIRKENKSHSLGGGSLTTLFSISFLILSLLTSRLKYSILYVCARPLYLFRKLALPLQKERDSKKDIFKMTEIRSSLFWNEFFSLSLLLSCLCEMCRSFIVARETIHPTHTHKKRLGFLLFSSI